MVDWRALGSVGMLADALTRLATTAEEQHDVREAMLGLLARQDDVRVAEELTWALAKLDLTEKERHQAQGRVLGLLASQDRTGTAKELALALTALDPTVEDRRKEPSTRRTKRTHWLICVRFSETDSRLMLI